jgi:DNA-binding response OmpR family regulator
MQRKLYLPDEGIQPFSGFRINEENREIYFFAKASTAKHKQTLTASEYRIFISLLTNHRNIMRDDYIYASERDKEGTSRYLDVLISGLNKKLKIMSEGRQHKLVANSFRDIGYQLQAHHQNDPSSKHKFRLRDKNLFLSSHSHQNLITFCNHFNRVVTPEQLGYSPKGTGASKAVRRLQKCFEEAKINCIEIKNLFGIGYKLQHKSEQVRKKIPYDSNPNAHMINSILKRHPNLLPASYKPDMI